MHQIYLTIAVSSVSLLVGAQKRRSALLRKQVNWVIYPAERSS